MEQQDGSKRIRSHNAKNNAGVRRIEVPGGGTALEKSRGM